MDLASPAVSGTSVYANGLTVMSVSYSIATCFDAFTSSSGSLFLYMQKLQNKQSYKINKINRLKCLCGWLL